MSKIIIHNYTDDDKLAIEALMSVIAMGKISNNQTQYSYVSTFDIENKTGKRKLIITSTSNKKGSYTFYIAYEKTNQ